MSTIQTPIVIGEPGPEPVTVEEARQHLEAQPYGDSDIDPLDDAMIDDMIAAARERCEDFLGLSLSRRTLEIGLDTFPTCSSRHRHSRDDRRRELGISLPMGPVIAIVSVQWGDESDQILGDDSFVFDRYRSANTLLPIASSWPSFTGLAPNALKIRYLAGYGEDSDATLKIPAATKRAILLTVGHFYEHRSDVEDGSVVDLPMGAKALLRPKRVRLGMA